MQSMDNGGDEDGESVVGATDPSHLKLIDGEALLSPRMAAEREIVGSIKEAGEAVRDILSPRLPESVAEAMAMKTRANLAMQILEAANAIGSAAANGGKASNSTSMQLPAAGIQSGSLATLLAQRMAAKRNASNTTHVVQRRIVNVVAEEAQPMAAVDAADGDGAKTIEGDTKG